MSLLLSLSLSFPCHCFLSLSKRCVLGCDRSGWVPRDSRGPRRRSDRLGNKPNCPTTKTDCFLTMMIMMVMMMMMMMIMIMMMMISQTHSLQHHYMFLSYLGGPQESKAIKKVIFLKHFLNSGMICFLPFIFL